MMEVVVLLVLGGSLVLSIAPALDAAMRSLSRALIASSFLTFLSHAAPSSTSQLQLPPGFPQSANALFYNSPADLNLWSTEWLPIGNGYLGAMVPGGTTWESVQINIESLWSGGPFADPVRVFRCESLDVRSYVMLIGILAWLFVGL